MSWSGSPLGFSRDLAHGPARPSRTATSRTEIIQLAIAYVVLTVDIMLLLGGPYFFEGPVLLYAVIGASAALTGFVAHEVAHKVVAQMSGYWAEFRLSIYGLVLSLITATVGFLFALPGATVIGGMGNPRDWGRTSLAGPMVNFSFALAFVAASAALRVLTPLSDAAGIVLFIGFINAWFAAFNMIPFSILDGAKVMRWNRSIWAAAFVTFAALAGVLGYYVYYVGLASY